MGHHQNPLKDWLKQIARPILRVSELLDRGQGHRVCVCNKFPGNPVAVLLGLHFENHCGRERF